MPFAEYTYCSPSSFSMPLGTLKMDALYCVPFIDESWWTYEVDSNENKLLYNTRSNIQLEDAATRTLLTNIFDPKQKYQQNDTILRFTEFTGNWNARPFVYPLLLSNNPS